jgi:hypothetical protein
MVLQNQSRFAVGVEGMRANVTRVTPVCDQFTNVEKDCTKVQDYLPPSSVSLVQSVFQSA